MREVELLCDHVMMMCQGQLIEQGSPKELMETHGRSSLEEVFLALNEEGVLYEFFHSRENLRLAPKVFFPPSLLVAQSAGNCILANCTDDYLGLYIAPFFTFQPGTDDRRHPDFGGFNLGLFRSISVILCPSGRDVVAQPRQFIRRPLRSWELILSLALVSMIRTLIGMIPAALLAIPFWNFCI